LFGLLTGSGQQTNKAAVMFDHILKDDHHWTISATFWPTWLTCLDSSFQSAFKECHHTLFANDIIAYMYG
jgi:hypothetical protein